MHTIIPVLVEAANSSANSAAKVSACSVWTALRFKDRMVKVIMDVSALKDQKKGIVLQSTVLLSFHLHLCANCAWS